MSDFPSLNDLLAKKSTANNDDSLKPVENTQTKFVSKIKDIKKKELEMEAIRLAVSLGVPHINLERFPISHEALRQIPQSLAEEIGLICFFAIPDEVRFGALDPTNPKVIEFLTEFQEKNQVNQELYLISENSFQHVIDLYKTLPIIKPITKDIEIHSDDLSKVEADVNDFNSFQALLNRRTTTDLITIILGAAMKLDASDVHIESEENRIMVRLRLDGILHDAAVLPKESFKLIVSRIKLISSLKININDKPQDGRFTIKMPDSDVDVRVSTMPTVYGESIVMRLLRQKQEGLLFDQLGIFGEAFERLKKEIIRPNGMIITTGPTGSGKTTTLYSVLKVLNKPGVKIITLEDPVEYKLEGINQSQIERSKDYNFANGLKSVLRQDPDIVMVGEIRDLETADTAIQAALTGHLMLSTLHTNSASAAIPRFLSMGVKPFLLSPALNCIIGQRLVRKICKACKKPINLSEIADINIREKVIELINKLPEKEKSKIEKAGNVFFESNGCVECNNIGYKGRIGIYEIFTINREIEQLILSGKISEYEIEDIAIKNGMITMAQDGILKAVDGITSLSEVFRVIE